MVAIGKTVLLVCLSFFLLQNVDGATGKAIQFCFLFMHDDDRSGSVVTFNYYIACIGALESSNNALIDQFTLRTQLRVVPSSRLRYPGRRPRRKALPGILPGKKSVGILR